MMGGTYDTSFLLVITLYLFTTASILLLLSQLVMLCCPIMLILFVITPVISLRSPNQLLQAEQLTPLFGDKTNCPITGFR